MAMFRPLDIQYLGIPGLTATCGDSILRLLQFGDQVDRVQILTAGSVHGLMLHVNEHYMFAVKTGFRSGYSGEGAKTFSFVLKLLESHGADIEEYEVGDRILHRLNRSSLSESDRKMLAEAKPIRPERWRAYVLGKDNDAAVSGKLWGNLPPVMPYAIIDPRIMDLAIGFFKAPDKALLDGFRRLEGLIKERGGTEGFGVKLFEKAFDPDIGTLTWNNIPPSEQKRRMGLFVAAYGAYRNPRAHNLRKETTKDYLVEFLMLNTLFRLEKLATLRKPSNASTNTDAGADQV